MTLFLHIYYMVWYSLRRGVCVVPCRYILAIWTRCFNLLLMVAYWDSAGPMHVYWVYSSECGTIALFMYRHYKEHTLWTCTSNVICIIICIWSYFIGTPYIYTILIASWNKNNLWTECTYTKGIISQYPIHWWYFWICESIHIFYV